MKMSLKDIYRAKITLMNLRREKLKTKFAFRLKRATRPIMEIAEDLDEQLAEIRKEHGEPNPQGGHSITPGSDGAKKAGDIIDELFKEEVEVKLTYRIPEKDFVEGVKEMSAEDLEAIEFLFLESGHGDEKKPAKKKKAS
jgi:hypothetical protein